MSDAEHPVIFTSYTKDLSDYVELIIDKIQASLPDARIFDWQREPLGAGASLNDLRKKIEHSRVFIAFISGRYKEGVALDELKWFVEKLEKQDLYFAPFLFSEEAKAWWDTFRSSGQASSVLTKVVEARLYEGGRPFQPTKPVVGMGKDALNSRIETELQPVIRQLAEFLSTPSNREKIPDSVDSKTPSLHPTDPMLFILAHPYERLEKDAATAKKTLIQELKQTSAGHRVREVPDAWNGMELPVAEKVFKDGWGHPAHVIQVADVALANALTEGQEGEMRQQQIAETLNRRLFIEAAGATQRPGEKPRDVRKILWVPAELDWDRPGGAPIDGNDRARLDLRVV